MENKMKAVIYAKYGSPEVLKQKTKAFANLVKYGLLVSMIIPAILALLYILI